MYAIRSYYDEDNSVDYLNVKINHIVVFVNSQYDHSATGTERITRIRDALGQISTFRSVKGDCLPCRLMLLLIRRTLLLVE